MHGADRCLIVGLTGRTDLNGRTCTLREFSDGRWSCSLEVDGEVVRVLPANLSLISVSPGLTTLQNAVLALDVPAIMRAIASSGCDVNARTPWGGSALLLAIEIERLDIVELLVNAGADIAVLKPNGAHALILAAEFCKADSQIIDILIARGLDGFVNRPDHHGGTAVGFAVQNGNLSALHALVRHGGDLYDTDIVRLFRSSGSGAIWSDDHTATFKQLIRWGADVDATGADGLTGVHYAIQNDFLKGFELLAEHGADLTKPQPACQGRTGNSPAHAAFIHGRRSFLKVLLQYGHSVSPDEVPRLQQLRRELIQIAQDPPKDLTLYEVKHGVQRLVTDPVEVAKYMERMTILPKDPAQTKKADAFVMRTICASCGQSSKDTMKKHMVCSRCKAVSYCSVPCQRAHWKKHKAVCSATRP